MINLLLVVAGFVVAFIIYKIYLKMKKNKATRAIKANRLEFMKKQYIGEDLFVNMKTGKILALDLTEIEYISDEIFDCNIHKDSNMSSILPIKISDVEECWWSRTYSFVIRYEVREDIFEFEILYCSDFDAIARSPILGDVYLSKEKYLQYEVGKKINLKFVTKLDQYTLRNIHPEIV